MWLLTVMLGLAHAQTAPGAEPAPAEPAEPADAAAAEGDVSEADEERARVLFQNGRRLYSEGSYAAAIEAWKACHALSARPELLYNISNAYERLGNAQLALEYLNSYRAQGELAAEEHDRLARKASTLETRVREQQAAEASTGRKPRTGGVVVTVGSGLALVGGAVLGMLAMDARDEVATACFDNGNGLLCPESASGAVRRAERNGTLSLVALGVGGVGMISGITLLASPGPEPEAGVEVSFAF